jgi:hypothetical protein
VKFRVDGIGEGKINFRVKGKFKFKGKNKGKFPLSMS